MSQHSSSSEHGRWPFAGESKGTFNLLNKRATISNQHGRLHEADSDDYRPLRDLNAQVAVANITSGSMMVPFYNSKATKIAIVTNGRGYFEMACPHLASQQQERGEEQRGEREEEQGRYKKVRSQVSENTVFVVPPGHPVAIVASREQNLEVVCFEVNAEGNRRTFVAGRDNIVSKMEREAKELAFGVPSKLVDEVFGGRQVEGFVRGPQSSQREEERRPLESILDFVGF